MAKNLRSWMLGLMVLAVGGLAYLASEVLAGETKLGPDVRKVADAIKKGDTAGAEAMAAKIGKKAEELDNVMTMFKLRTKGGLGICAMPQPKADGIEMRFRDIARDAPSNMAKEGPCLEQAGYDTAAVALITKSMAPKDMGKKKSADFKRWAGDMYESGIELAKDAKAGGAQNVKSAAAKVNASCNSCHSVFRE